MDFWRKPTASLKRALVRYWLRCVLAAIVAPLLRFNDALGMGPLYAAGTTPIFIDTVRTPGARLSVANTNRDGSTGTYATLFTAGADGCLFAGFRFQAEQNTTAGAVRLFRQDAGAGNVELLKEMVVPAITFSAGVTPPAEGEWYPPAGIMGSGGTVFKSSTHIGEAIGVFLEGGGDY